MRVFTGRMKISGGLTCAGLVAKEVFSLPIEPLQKVEDTMYVVKSIKQFSKVN